MNCVFVIYVFLCCSVCWFVVRVILSWCPYTCHIYIVYTILSMIISSICKWYNSVHFVYPCKMKCLFHKLEKRYDLYILRARDGRKYTLNSTKHLSPLAVSYLFSSSSNYFKSCQQLPFRKQTCTQKSNKPARHRLNFRIQTKYTHVFWRMSF